MDSGPTAPVAITFDDEAITDPERPERVAPAVAPATEMRAGPISRLVAWAVDTTFLAAFVAGQMGLAARLFPGAYFLEEVRLWGALAACLTVAYSWIFVALGARTPGMALTRQRLQT